LRLLLNRRQAGGWGYHALLPADSDTTTWVLRLASAVGAPRSERLRQARAFLAAQTDITGGVATYPVTAAPALEQFLEMPGPYDGWCATHVCVTAAAGLLELDPRIVSFLLATQRPDGAWSPHWWDDDVYATLRAVEVLNACGESAAVSRACRWTEALIGDDGAVVSVDDNPSAFATALAASTLQIGAAGASPGRERALAWLLCQQREDGSWHPSARLRVPAPGQKDPLARPETSLTYLDGEAVFTTATVLSALADA
jgi:squalene cyclase